MFHVLVDFQEKCEEAVKLCKDMEEKIYSLQTESKKFEMELDAAIREKVTYRDVYLIFRDGVCRVDYLTAWKKGVLIKVLLKR